MAKAKEALEQSQQPDSISEPPASDIRPLVAELEALRAENDRLRLESEAYRLACQIRQCERIGKDLEQQLADKEKEIVALANRAASEQVKPAE